MASRFILQTSSGSKKMKWNGCFGLKPRLHTHKEHEPKFLSLLHTSCVRDCRSTQIHIYIYRNLFKVLRPVRGPAKTLHCVLLKDSSLIVAFGVGPKINIPSSFWVLVRPSILPYAGCPSSVLSFFLYLRWRPPWPIPFQQTSEQLSALSFVDLHFNLQRVATEYLHYLPAYRDKKST